ncbi:MAG: hypothetical protein JWO54_925 [Candidatus Saccharibacteria bacterium]|nr:hypothetical protein [Candidatus Saccharibacteria bacterium]
MYKDTRKNKKDRTLKLNKAKKSGDYKDCQEAAKALADFIYDVFREQEARSVKEDAKAKPSNRSV